MIRNPWNTKHQSEKKKQNEKKEFFSMIFHRRQMQMSSSKLFEIRFVLILQTKKKHCHTGRKNYSATKFFFIIWPVNCTNELSAESQSLTCANIRKNILHKFLFIFFSLSSLLSFNLEKNEEIFLAHLIASKSVVETSWINALTVPFRIKWNSYLQIRKFLFFR